MIRGRNVNDALDLLKLQPQRGAAFFEKVLLSAIANAAQDEEVDTNSLFVADARATTAMLNNRLRYRPGLQAARCRRRRPLPTVIVASAATIAASDEAEEGANAEGVNRIDGTEDPPPGYCVGIIEPWASRWHGSKHDFARLPSGQDDPRSYREGVWLRRHPAHRDRAHQ